MRSAAASAFGSWRARMTPKCLCLRWRMPMVAEELVPGGGDAVVEGQMLWQPSAERVARCELTKFYNWLKMERGLEFGEYEDCWRWSVDNIDAFWTLVWEYFDVRSDTAFTQVRLGDAVEGTRWFPGSRTNYAEHLLRYEEQARPDEVAIVHSGECRAWGELTWEELGSRVRTVAVALRAAGVEPGDRVASYMPNVWETVVAMLASIAIGAVWSAAAPEFGATTVIERFGQIRPKLMFATDGYSFNGKVFDRRRDARTIAEGLPDLRMIVWLDNVGLERAEVPGIDNVTFDELLSPPTPDRGQFRYERVAHDHPLWVLFSSGTTGLPKAIAHAHAGMIVEHLKIRTWNANLSPRTRSFVYTTTGWMMWNSLVSSLITGSSIVLYDGSPTFGGADALWRLASESGATLLGVSPTLVQTMKAAGISPGKTHDLSKLDSIQVGGAPVTPEVYAWFFEHVKKDLWVSSASGGTEICSGFVAGVPTRPVYAAEISGRGFGIDAHAWNDEGQAVIDEIGELVIVSPFPTMPLYFWNDSDGQRYHESYFDTFPGVWRHGDQFKVNVRGGCYIYGRSDSTLNRYGVRIGTAEIYRVISRIAGIRDSLVICGENSRGDCYMPLFLQLDAGRELDPALIAEITARLRAEASPRHVPDEFHAVPAIPYTLTGKKMEVPIRKIVMGADPGRAASRDTMADPAALDWFVDFASRAAVIARR
ncbi:acetoacetate--CoA ligase [Sphingobium ummariense]